MESSSKKLREAKSPLLLKLMHTTSTYSAGWAGWRPQVWSSVGEGGEYICSQIHNPETRQHLSLSRNTCTNNASQLLQ